MENSNPKLTDDQMNRLYCILNDNPLQEVVGYFRTDENNSQSVLEIVEVAKGDDEKVAYREFNPFPFHTHPLSALRMAEPPSGEDLVQSLSWGYPDFNEKKVHCTWECVVAAEGLWWYRGTPGLLAIYFDLQDVDEEKQNYLAKQTIRYCNVICAMLKNNMMTLVDFFRRNEMMDFAWMSEILEKNNSFLQYIQKQFPLESMTKLQTLKYSDFHAIPGFEIIFETR
jgi:hypothetical protein